MRSFGSLGKKIRSGKGCSRVPVIHAEYQGSDIGAIFHTRTS